VLQQSKYSATSSAGGVPILVLVGAIALPCVIAIATNSTHLTYAVHGSTVAPYLVLQSKLTGLLGGSNWLNSTAVYVLVKLEALAKSHPDIIANISDARTFAKSLPPDLLRPEVWTDDETEVAFEWKDSTRHAMVSFEGNNSFGYAMRRGNRFTPGSFPGDLKAGIPRDLVNYLKDKPPK
jgi:hypothetical protein